MWTAIGAWLWRFIGGLLPVGQKPFPEWAGKMLWAVVICVAVNMVLTHFFPQKVVTTIGQGGVQNVYSEQRDVAGIGCNIFRLYVKGGLKSK